MKTDLVQIRITPDDKAAFRDAAKSCGVSLSEWLIEAARRWLHGKKGDGK